ncbi:MAG TPA: CocE/NonD family hydrolase [Streptosporangiaceae bacterium]
MTAVSPADRAGSSPEPQPLADVAPDLAAVLAGTRPAARVWEPAAISLQTVLVPMRDGIRLATDVYLPPTGQAPAIALRTPYGRATQETTFLALACAGYAVVAQDCRGTGDSEPDQWDFYVYERADSLDFVSWVTGQDWYAGFLGAMGGSYVGGTQWCMAMHPQMSAIAPEVAGLGLVARTGVRFHMFANAYSRTVGKGAGKVAVDLAEMERAMLAETLATGYFNDPLQAPLRPALLERYPHLSPLPPGAARRALWEHYCQAGSDERAGIIRLALGLGAAGITISDVERLDSVFPHAVHTDAHMLPATSEAGLCAGVRAPALMITGWYDWCLDDALHTWELLAEHGRPEVRAASRLLITPSAHQAPGYHEGRDRSPELDRIWRDDPDLLVYWHDAVRTGSAADLPVVTYYLMGANQWCAAGEWPPAQARRRELYFGPAGTLCWDTPPDWWEPDRYTYDPRDPTPTVGGSILSAVYPPGSADVTELQLRTDVLTFTTEPLAEDLDVVGPLSLVLYASSTAADTDFFARLSDVFPDGRAVQLQNGVVRGRYRDAEGDPALLEPGTIYCLEINMAATANRFAAGHRLRVDVCSADFPKLERNGNRGGEPGPPVRAVQTIFHGSAYPSHLVVHVI